MKIDEKGDVWIYVDVIDSTVNPVDVNGVDTDRNRFVTISGIRNADQKSNALNTNQRGFGKVITTSIDYIQWKKEIKLPGGQLYDLPKTSVNLKNGVLTINIPVVLQVQPISVSADQS